MEMQQRSRLVSLGGLAALGLVISVQLTVLHIRHVQTGNPSSCNLGGAFNCDVVNTSAWSEIGPLPVSHLASVLYVALLALLTVGFRRTAARDRIQALVSLLGVSAVAVSLALAGVSALILQAFCVYCLSLYVVNACLLLLSWGGLGIREQRRSLLTGGTVFSAAGDRSAGRMAVLVLVLVAGGSSALVMHWNAQAHAVAQARGGDPRVDLMDASCPQAGPADAVVTLVEISDFECPFCQRASETIAELRRLYPTQLRVVFRHFPLDPACNAKVSRAIHPSACSAARAAVCAGDQGKFWQYAEKLFAGAVEPADQRQHAQDLGLAIEDWTRCVEGPTSLARVQQDIAACSRVAEKGVPLFFVNGRRIAGARPIADFRQIIDAELAKVGR